MSEQEPGERARLIAELKATISEIDRNRRVEQDPYLCGAEHDLYTRCLAALTPPPSHSEEKEAVARIDTMGAGNDRRTAPTNELEAFREASVKAYWLAQEHWSGQHFCFTSAPESMRRNAHEVARNGFNELVNALGPVARPVIQAEWDEASRLAAQVAKDSAITASDSQPVGGRVENRDWLEFAQSLPTPDASELWGHLSNRLTPSSSPDQEGIETLIAEWRTNIADLDRLLASGHYVGEEFARLSECAAARRADADQLAALLPPKK